MRSFQCIHADVGVLPALLQECYHEIHAIPLLDPVLDKQVR